MEGVEHDGSLTLDTAQLERVIADMRRPKDSALREAIRGRLRDLQKRKFPEAARAGRGKRSLYGLSDILKVAIAMELVDLDLASSRVIAIVEGGSDIFLRQAVIGWRVASIAAEHPGADGYRHKTARLLSECVIVPKATDADGRQYVRAETPRRSATRARSSAWPGRRGRVTLSLHHVVEDLMQALIAAFRFTQEEVDGAFRKLGLDEFGTDDEAAWTLESKLVTAPTA